MTDEFDGAFEKAVFEDTLKFLSRVTGEVLGRLPEMEARQRGEETLNRFPEKSVRVALALKLVQLVGNVRAGELLIRNGLLFEWDALQRTMHDATEDVTFLIVAEESGGTKVLGRYLESFFEEDIDKDGTLADRANAGVRVERGEIRRAIAEKGREMGVQDSRAAVEQSRRLHRLRSGSVHGRGASIVRAYFDPSAEHGIWLGESPRDAWRIAWELPVLFAATSQVVSAFGVAVAGRSYGKEFVRQIAQRVERLQHCRDRMIRSLRADG